MNLSITSPIDSVRIHRHFVNDGVPPPLRYRELTTRALPDLDSTLYKRQCTNLINYGRIIARDCYKVLPLAGE